MASELIKMFTLFSFPSLNSFKAKADDSAAQGEKGKSNELTKIHGLNAIIATSFKARIIFSSGALVSACSLFPCSMLMANFPFTSRFQ